MSAQSGITASEALKTAWATASADGGIRAVKIVINGTEMEEDASGRIAKKGSLEEDWKEIASKLGKDPAYFLIRTDATTSSGDAFICALFVPEETAQVKDKMLYASSRDTLKKDLGRSFFTEEYHASDVTEMGYGAYKASKAAEASEATRESLLTDAERAKKEEAVMEKDLHGQKENVHGVAFSLTDSARANLESFKAGRCNWASVFIDVDAEKIDGGETKTVANDAVNAAISATEAFFYFFRYNHQDRDGGNQTLDIFIYSCPDSVPIKKKMLSSSVKGAALQQAEALGIKVAKKVEISEPSDFVLDDVYEELYPQAQKQKVITRAAPAAGRGGRRLIRKT